MKSNLIRHIAFIAISLLLIAAPGINAQQRAGGAPGRASGSASSAPSAKNDSTKPKRKSTAWTLKTPLGEHEPAVVDTLQYNYQRQFIPSLASDAYVSTGPCGSPGINMIYFERPHSANFFFDNALHQTLPTLSKMKFYNVYVPMTLLSYNYGGDRNNHADRLNAIFAGNVNRNIGIGAFIDYNYQKGAYSYQAAKGLTFGFTFYFNSPRYEAQAFYNHFNDLNQDNGGITDDLYITDPAVVQGGVDKVEPKSIPTRLSAASTRLIGDRLFMTHAFKIGYWQEEQVNDTLTRDNYIPVTKFVYSLDYSGREHVFKNNNASQGAEFWKNTYIDPTGTYDNTKYWTVTNSIGIQLLEGFRKWAKFGISAYASLETSRITQAPYGMLNPDLSDEQLSQLTPLPQGFNIPGIVNQNRLSVGGSISKSRGELLKYSANVRFGLTDDIAGDIDAYGDISSRFKLFGDTVEISAHGGFHNRENPYLLSHYVSNHFAWNSELGKTRRFEFGGRLFIPWTKTTFSADFRDVQNLVYFNSEGLPTQHSPHVQILALRLDQKLRFGIWNWNNTITYQVSSDQSVLPLPALAIYSNMFLEFRAFRVLNIQLGIDCDYYTRYYGYTYQPATMSFCVQQEKKVGNFPLCNAYLSCKLYKVRFYLLYSHANQGWFTRDYFSMPNYPVNPRCFQLGLCIDFAN